jgi:NADPH:quinone reductase-like Zn-dependent oxidoreductase
LQAAADGKLKVLLDRVLPLRDAALAHELVDGRGGLGKVVLDPTL